MTDIDDIWKSDTNQQVNKEVRQLYIEHLKNGGLVQLKAMNMPKMEGELISGAKQG